MSCCYKKNITRTDNIRDVAPKTKQNKIQGDEHINVPCPHLFLCVCCFLFCFVFVLGVSFDIFFVIVSGCAGFYYRANSF